MKSLLKLIFYIILIVIGLTFYNNIKNDNVPDKEKIEKTTDDVKTIADDARDETKKTLKDLKEWWNED